MNKSICKNTLPLMIQLDLALSNNLGSIDAAEYRTGLQPLMTIEDTKQYAIQAVTRAALRRDNFTSKLGRFEYSIGKYSKLLRAVIPIEKGGEEIFLLLSLDVDSDVVGIIENKVLRFLKDNIRDK